MSFRENWICESVDSSRSGPPLDCCGLNNGIRSEVLDLATRLNCYLFENVGMEPTSVLDREKNVCPGLIYAEAGEEAFVVYVRVTFENEEVEGTGPMPERLLNAARALRAVPRVLRVHFTAHPDGTRVSYFGHEELARALRATNYWRRRLIGRRTAKDYLRLTGGSPAKLHAEVWHQAPGKWPGAEIDTEEERLLRRIFGEEGKPAAEDFPGAIHVGLHIDMLPGWSANRAVSLTRLLESTRCNDEHFIFSCTCGVPECADVRRGVETVHEQGLVVWRIRGLSPRRVVVFERQQYCQEVVRVIREALELQNQLGPDAWLGADDRPDELKAALRSIGRTV